MRRLFVIILLALIIAACGSSPPEQVLTPDNLDWCYLFNFTADDYGADVLVGQHTPNGFQSTNGTLAVTYNHPQLVEPALVLATIQIVLPNFSEPRDIIAYADVFGLEAQQFETSVPETAVVELPLFPQYAGLASSKAEVIVNTDNDVIVNLQYLEVRGYGYNPFPSNGCSKLPTATPTNEILPSITPMPTNTPTATSTPTQTYTPEPTNTPQPTDISPWCHIFDFTTSTGGWAAYVYSGQWSGTAASYTSGVGWESTLIYNSTKNASNVLTQIQIDQVMTIDSVEVRYDLTKGSVDNNQLIFQIGSSAGNLFFSNVASNFTNGTDLTLSWSGSSTVSFLNIRVDSAYEISGYPSVNGYSRIKSVEITGTGVNPFGMDNCNITPTPTPTNTPDVEATATAGGATLTPTTEATLNPTEIQATSYMQQTEAAYTSTPLPTYTAFPTTTPFPTPYIPPTPPPNSSGGGNGFTGNGSCSSYAGDEPNTDDDGQWTEWLFGGIRSLVDCVVMPPIFTMLNIINSTLQAVSGIYNFFVMLPTWLSGDLFPYLGGYFGNIGTQLTNLIRSITNLAASLQGIFGFLSGIGAIIGNTIAVVTGFISTVQGFTNLAENTIFGFVDGYRLTTPQSPPGVPDCINAPLESDICAIHWFLDNSVFSGVLGQLILQAMSFVVNVLIVMYIFQISQFFASSAQDLLDD